MTEETEKCQELIKSAISSSSNIGDSLYWSYIANAVLNAFSLHTSVFFNIVAIIALSKISYLPKPLKTLLFSLAVSDLGVGLLVQPFYITLMVKWLLQTEPNCFTKTSLNIIIWFFGFSSFFGVFALTVDRFLAIQLHLRYQELVTHKRVVAAVITIWMFSALLSLTFGTALLPRYMFVACFGPFCVAVMALLNYKILLAVRQHTNQIQALQIQEIQQTAGERTSVRKFAVGTFYVFVTFLVCYLPRVCCLVSLLINGPTNFNECFSLYSWTLVFLNSSLNPLIYCWKIRQIRTTIMNMLRNIFPGRN